MIDFLVKLGIPKAYTGDVGLFLMILLVSVALVFVVRKTKLGAFAYSVYAAYFIVESIDYVIDGYNLKIWLFLGLTFLVYYLLFRATVVVKLGGRSFEKWFKRVSVSFLIVGLMISIVVDWLPIKEAVRLLPPFWLRLFTENIFRMFWAVAPLLAMMFLRRKE